MPTRRGKRPSPLQERYYRAGLNAGAVLVLEKLEEQLGMSLKVLRGLVTRVRCRGVQTSAPFLSPVHPMAAWSKKRRGR